MNKTMKNVNGYEVNKKTPKSLIRVLESLLTSRIRVTIDYGDTESGKSFNETYDVTGYIGLSTGCSKIFLLTHNSRSIGGGAILTGNILSIKHANKKNGGVIYKI